MTVTRNATDSTPARSLIIILVAGRVISLVGFAVRSSFGLFLEPMTTANRWSRETFARALAIQKVRYMTTLFGFVFLRHQLGSFLGGRGAWAAGGAYPFAD